MHHWCKQKGEAKPLRYVKNNVPVVIQFKDEKTVLNSFGKVGQIPNHAAADKRNEA